MRPSPNALIEPYRVLNGRWSSTQADGNNGLFFFPGLRVLRVIASDGLGWEHVSVSVKGRTPSWEQMAFVKDRFWGEDEAVMQVHPPQQLYVNNHPHCLHLWRPLGEKIPLPPPILLGIAGVGAMTEQEAKLVHQILNR